MRRKTLLTSSRIWIISLLLAGASLGLASNDEAEDPPPGKLADLAAESLAANIVSLPTGHYLSAGDRQFRGLWTRDFCFASRGLLSIGREDVVRDHLSRILSFVREKDGLVPRYLDNRTVVERYANLLLGKNLEVSEPLKPNYSGGGSATDGVAIDSNSLVLLAALDYARRTGDSAWWDRHEDALVRVLAFHRRHLRDGLIWQGRSADWQDSVNRTGHTFYTNILYWAAVKRLQHHPRFGIARGQADELKRRIMAAFHDPATGLYFSIAGQPQISLDGILLAIDLGFHPPGSAEARALYAALKRHPLWTRNGMPGFATYPDYPQSSLEPMPQLTGMRHYHDRIYWSWLMALAAKTAFAMKDAAEGERILAKMQQLAVRDRGISEVFRPEPELRRVVTFAYRSELPFSWGAGMLLDALAARP